MLLCENTELFLESQKVLGSFRLRTRKQNRLNGAPSSPEAPSAAEQQTDKLQLRLPLKQLNKREGWEQEQEEQESQVPPVKLDVGGETGDVCRAWWSLMSDRAAELKLDRAES